MSANSYNPGPTSFELKQSRKAELAEIETYIEKFRLAAFVVGEKLKRVKSEKLYLEDYGTFEAYCLKRWDLSARQAYQWIEAFEVRKQTGFADLQNEAQARALAQVDPADRARVWASATQYGERVTAAGIIRAWKELTHARAEPRAEPRPKAEPRRAPVSDAEWASADILLPPVKQVEKKPERTALTVSGGPVGDPFAVPERELVPYAQDVNELIKTMRDAAIELTRRELTAEHFREMNEVLDVVEQLKVKMMA